MTARTRWAWSSWRDSRPAPTCSASSRTTIPISRLKAEQDIPIGHKVALTDIKSGDTIWKYGQDIGKAVADIRKGHHVHTQNVKTKRW